MTAIVCAGLLLAAVWFAHLSLADPEEFAQIAVSARGVVRDAVRPF